MNNSVEEHFFKTREEASIATAAFMADAARRSLDNSENVSLVVSGGSSPAKCFAELSRTALPWSRIQLLLSDERWVPPDDDASNEKMIRELLLTGLAAEADLLPIFEAKVSIASRCHTLAERVAQTSIPFACSLLGMGEDGHFASLFPDAENLAAGLDIDNTDSFIPVTTTASPQPRVSMTLALMVQSDAIALLIFGEAKRDAYEQAMAGVSAFPVAGLLHQDRAPVHVFWAP